MPQTPYAALLGITVTAIGIHKILLLKLKLSKAHGPDAIPKKIIIYIADQIALFLARLFKQSTDTGEITVDWKNANISALFKDGDTSVAVNYKPV